MKNAKMRNRCFALVIMFVQVCLYTNAQTCTVTGTSPLNWVNPGPNCSEGGTASGKTILIVPPGFTLNLDTNTDTWTGTQIEVYGTVTVTANPTFNCSFIIRNGGRLNLQGKLSLGTSSGCGYTIAVQSGGVIDVGGTGSDRLGICGVDVMKGNGTCNSCGGTNSGQCAYDGNPYCEPAAGFTGPTGYGQTGYDATLPIKLSYFQATLKKDVVELNWATEMEENFDHFEIERAGSDLIFNSILSVPGDKDNASSWKEYAAVDEAPIMGFNYYRLKAVDVDGTSQYFRIVSVDYQGGRRFYVSPNPTDGSSIQYVTNFDPSADDRIALMDAVGNTLVIVKVTASKGEIVPKKTLSSGAYLLRYMSTNYEQVVRVFVKE